MKSRHGSLELLNDPVAQKLLVSNNPAHLAYNWIDGTPRVIPIWFYWNGTELVMGSPPGAPKIQSLQDGSKAAVCIDDKAWPYKVLYLRGTVQVEWVNGIAPEYALAAERYLGEEAGKGWVEQVKTMTDRMFRVAFKPDWVSISDFETRFPSAVEKALTGG
ncbi:MAG TPA: pyridoxamine 5'-phosphate oxidase [Spirillospora sp.]|nr:pyridoxamine 5'-phosphate oxidase [Spirillospora sp.]